MTLQFVDQNILNFFLILPAFLFLLIYVKKRKSDLLTKLISKKNEHLIISNHSFMKEWIRFLLFFLILGLMIFTLARPQWGEKKSTIKHKGVDILFLLDTSLSMLAEDIRPNRFEKAKLQIKSFVEKTSGNRLGLLPFSGSAYLECPLTIDKSAFFLFLNAVSVGSIPDPGTDLNQALSVALEGLQSGSQKNKVMIIFSDGESHFDISDSLLNYLKDPQVRIYCIGLGSKEGEPIPLKDESNQVRGHKKDKEGQMVITKLNDASLKKIAKISGGKYFKATTKEREIDSLVKEINELEKTDFETEEFAHRQDQFKLFLKLILILALLDILIGERKISFFARKKSHLPFLIVFSFFSMAFNPSLSEPFRKGADAYEKGDYEAAYQFFQQARSDHPDSTEILYNIANTEYKLKRYDAAQKHFSEVLKILKKDDALEENILFNLGNTYYQLEENEKAKETFIEVLKRNPSNQDAKYNLETIIFKDTPFHDEKSDQKDPNDDDSEKPQSNEGNSSKSEKKDKESEKDKKDQDRSGEKNNPNQEDSKGEEDQDQSEDNQGDQEQDADKEDSKRDPGEGPTDQNKEQDSNEQNNAGQEKQPEQQKPQNTEEGQDQSASQDFGKTPPRDQEQQNEPPSSPIKPDQNMPPEYSPDQKSDLDLRGKMTDEEAEQILQALGDPDKNDSSFRSPLPPQNEEPVDKDW